MSDYVGILVRAALKDSAVHSASLRNRMVLRGLHAEIDGEGSISYERLAVRVLEDFPSSKYILKLCSER